MRVELIFVMMLFAGFARGQNKMGFETMVNTLLSHSVDTIDSNTLQAELESGQVVVLDAREDKEYQVSHIKGAIHVGYNDFDRSALKEISKDTPIVVYCSVGKRSEEIAMKLKAKGYENVKNHWGGIFDWTNRGLPVENSAGEPVKMVHPYNTLWGVWINNYEKAYEPR